MNDRQEFINHTYSAKLPHERVIISKERLLTNGLLRGGANHLPKNKHQQSLEQIDESLKESEKFDKSATNLIAKSGEDSKNSIHSRVILYTRNDSCCIEATFSSSRRFYNELNK